MTTINHKFTDVCIDFDAILQQPDIRKMIKVVLDQAKTQEAKRRTDIGNYKDYGDEDGSPLYFGMFVEWYAQEFLNNYGHVYNIGNVQMNDHAGGTDEDWGIDGIGHTRYKKNKTSYPHVAPASGTPVYIQVKGTGNHNKEHMANDGSRLPNFTTHAMSTAIKSKTAYQSRYILFTTAKGVYYTLDKMWNNMVEVIAIKQIMKMSNGDMLFLNHLRQSVGLDSLDYSIEPDAEAQYNLQQCVEV